ncbi:hypothetical protein COO59_08965 [Mixta theicola]|uniref:AprE-like beta-barrel domain-containing protein n=1 Tax=Mixta theicola TaxID=1458355 RepID=A0A2K1QAP4_9GAMM|nr:HlyD family efflux transporter periplasmic adaptor subunit [Mixta theicola]PNS12099.1 hypothetical protein COO59_08965 [Mixta theicola]GLR10731.1 secretion protein [Mixta theicola]
MTKIKKFFRPEAINYQQERFTGHILLTRPLSLTIITTFFLVLIMAIILFFTFFTYTRKAQVKGVLLPIQRVIRISAVEPGFVNKVLAHEGEEISAGKNLFILSNERFSSIQGANGTQIHKLLLKRKENLTEDYQVIKEQLARKKAGLQKKISNLNKEEQLSLESINIQKEQIKLFTDMVSRHLKLLQNKTVSQLEFNEKKSQLFLKKGDLIELQKQLAALTREQDNVSAELEQLLLQEKREYSLYQREINLIQKEMVEKNAQKNMHIVAPQDGIISTIVISEGQSIEEHTLLATLIPKDATLEANLFISSDSIGFLKLGMPVLLQYQAYPYQKFGQYRGIIHEISRNTLQPNDLLNLGVNIKASENETALYRIRLKLDNQEIKAYGKYYPLKTGMEFSASILLEERKIYEWILEPLYSIRGTL